MNDFSIMAKILVAIMAGQDKYPFDASIITNDCIIEASKQQKSRIAIRLQKEGYIDGLKIISVSENCNIVDWNNSKPELTINGMEYVDQAVL